MAFFQALDGSKYQLAQIVAISPRHEPRPGTGVAVGTHVVTLQSGDEVEVSENRIADLMRTPVQAYPAEPGTYVLTYDFDAPDAPMKWPVVGWAITMEGETAPITMNGVNEGLDGTPHVLLPTGQVTTYDTMWDDLEQWKASQDPQRTRAPEAG